MPHGRITSSARFRPRRRLRLCQTTAKKLSDDRSCILYYGGLGLPPGFSAGAIRSSAGLPGSDRCATLFGVVPARERSRSAACSPPLVPGSSSPLSWNAAEPALRIFRVRINGKCRRAVASTAGQTHFCVAGSHWHTSPGP